MGTEFIVESRVPVQLLGTPLETFMLNFLLYESTS